jgi:hypothetical protein
MPWFLIIGVPLIGGLIWLMVAVISVIPLPYWIFVIAPLAGIAMLPWYYARRWTRSRRRRAIGSAVRKMNPEERAEWTSRSGRYEERKAIPSLMPVELLTFKERDRWANRIGEFSLPEKYVRPRPSQYDSDDDFDFGDLRV